MLENKKDDKLESLNEENRIKELSEEELEKVTGGVPKGHILDTYKSHVVSLAEVYTVRPAGLYIDETK